MSSYYCAFDNTDFTGDITIASTGLTDKTVTLSSVTDADINGDQSSLYCHYPIGLGLINGQDPSSTVYLGKYSQTAFGQALVDAINAGSSWAASHTFQVDYDISEGKYTIQSTHVSATKFSLTFDNADLRTLLGYNGTQTGAVTYTSQNVVDYVVKPTLDAVSEPTPNYEPPGMATTTASDQGHPFTVSRTAAPLYRDWVQQFELKAKTIRLSQNTTHPWTFQELYEHCRQGFAIVVGGDMFGDGFDHMFQLRTEGSSFVPQRSSPGDDTQFHIPFNTHVVGRDSSGDGSWT